LHRFVKRAALRVWRGRRNTDGVDTRSLRIFRLIAERFLWRLHTTGVPAARRPQVGEFWRVRTFVPASWRTRESVQFYLCKVVSVSSERGSSSPSLSPSSSPVARVLRARVESEEAASPRIVLEAGPPLIVYCASFVEQVAVAHSPAQVLRYLGPVATMFATKETGASLEPEDLYSGHSSEAGTSEPDSDSDIASSDGGVLLVEQTRSGRPVRLPDRYS